MSVFHSNALRVGRIVARRRSSVKELPLKESMLLYASMSLGNIMTQRRPHSPDWMAELCAARDTAREQGKQRLVADLQAEINRIDTAPF